MRRRTIVPGILIALLSACTQTDRVDKAWVPPAGPPTIERLRVRGTTMELEFVRLPGAADSGRDLFVARTELTWAVAERFEDADEPEDVRAELGLDAITRPTKPYGSPYHDEWGPRGPRPAVHTTANYAAACAEWLGRLCGTPLRLPSESEWERLCSSVVRVPVEEYAWVLGNSEEQSHPVGGRREDALGLFDLQGNAAEWVMRPDGVPMLKGLSYLDPADLEPCVRAVPDDAALRNGDSQFPPSIWWRISGPFAGARFVFER